MRVVIQRVKNAGVSVDGNLVSDINQGLLLFVGISKNDNEKIVEKVADKIIKLRIFDDEHGKLNYDISKVYGEILSVSQFTLYADVKKGNRPSFKDAADVEKANYLYEYFNNYFIKNNIPLKKGIFQADMKVSLLNDGPITIIIDSNDL